MGKEFRDSLMVFWGDHGRLGHALPLPRSAGMLLSLMLVCWCRCRVNLQAAPTDRIIDYMELAVFGGALMNPDNRGPGFVAYLSCYFAAMLLFAARRRPERRELQACILRVAIFFPPFWGRVAARMLASLPPTSGSTLLRSLQLAGLVLYTTGTVPNISTAVGRRVRLWLQLLMQAAVMAAVLPRTDQLCRTPALEHASTGALLDAAYGGLRWLLVFTPIPRSLMVEHRAHGRCRCGQLQEGQAALHEQQQPLAVPGCRTGLACKQA